MLGRAVAAGCAAVLLAGCGAGQAPPPMPPLTAEPELPLFAGDATASQAPATSGGSKGEKARKALQRVLRGAGAGRAKVCGQVAPAYALTRLGAACAAWIAGLTEDDRARLRAVQVGAPSGKGPHAWVFEAADLAWPLGAPTSPAEARYVMRHKGGRWVLAG
ncbi:hypothetical protein GCM10022221_55500 [Actinocorallia aurea]